MKFSGLSRLSFSAPIDNIFMKGENERKEKGSA